MEVIPDWRRTLNQCYEIGHELRREGIFSFYAVAIDNRFRNKFGYNVPLFGYSSLREIFLKSGLCVIDYTEKEKRLRLLLQDPPVRFAAAPVPANATGNLHLMKTQQTRHDDVSPSVFEGTDVKPNGGEIPDSPESPPPEDRGPPAPIAIPTGPDFINEPSFEAPWELPWDAPNNRQVKILSLSKHGVKLFLRSSSGNLTPYPGSSASSPVEDKHEDLENHKETAESSQEQVDDAKTFQEDPNGSNP